MRNKNNVSSFLTEHIDSGCYDYDLIVIGGGSGGLACSKEGALVVNLIWISVTLLIYFNSCCIGKESGCS